MSARNTLHFLRILVTWAPELRSRCPSYQVPWPYEGRRMHVTIPVMYPVCTTNAASAVFHSHLRSHCSAVVLSHYLHYRGCIPCKTAYANDTAAGYHTAISANVTSARTPSTRPYIAWFGTGVTRGSHKCESRGMAERSSSGRMSSVHKRFLENTRLCREYVPHSEHGMDGKHKHHASRGKLTVLLQCVLGVTCDR